jgi:hypothetical protein
MLRNSGEKSGSKRRCFDIGGSNNRLAEYVGLKLHKEIINRSASVDAKFGDVFTRVGFHGIDKFAALEGDAFERGSDYVRFATIACEAGD